MSRLVVHKGSRAHNYIRRLIAPLEAAWLNVSTVGKMRFSAAASINISDWRGGPLPWATNWCQVKKKKEKKNRS